MKGRTALLAVLITIALLPVPAGVASAKSSALHWDPCYRRIGTFECSGFRVPLDYDDPKGPKITLSVVRMPASDPASRVGSIFLNPGGPGGSGVDFVVGAGPFLFSPEVRARFDLVGFDPRGILRSSPLLCADRFKQALAFFAPFFFPVTAEEESFQASLDVALNSACQRLGGDIVDHMATADVARDLDRLRAAVGDEQITYAGYSYGSYLGVTYANLFPDRVRALVVDGVLDPIAWATGRQGEAALPFSTRLRSDAGAMATLNEFFRLCDLAGGDCAFAPNAASRFAALADRLRAAPIEIVDPGSGDSFPFTYADLIGNALGAMYDSTSWSDFAQFLTYVETGELPTLLGVALREVQARTGLAAPPLPRYPNFVEGFPGVACSDTVNPTGHAYWSVAGAVADEQQGYFGRPWTWATSPCAVWEGFDADRYLGPFDHVTSNPVLVVGNVFDPATRYQGALTVHQLLPNSSLLRVEGWGHTSLFLSACADAAVSSYLLTAVPPPDGTTCTQDVAPFTPQDGVSRARQSVRAKIMSEVALVPWG
jgi:pimeloyl-ACP methyl ester carboxylesterase